VRNSKPTEGIVVIQTRNFQEERHCQALGMCLDKVIHHLIEHRQRCKVELAHIQVDVRSANCGDGKRRLPD
jgi:hypothetical protein